MTCRWNRLLPALALLTSACGSQAKRSAPAPGATDEDAGTPARPDTARTPAGGTAGGSGGTGGRAGSGGTGGSGGGAVAPARDAAASDASTAPARDAGGGDRTAVPPADAPSADAAGAIQRLLYVAAANGTIDVFAIEQNHRLLRKFQAPSLGAMDKGPAGLAAHAATRRLFVSEYINHTVSAIDLATEKLIWTRRGGNECTHPDRLTVTNDGKALYVPCHENDRVWILNAANGETLKVVPFAGRPHNSFTGEAGKYVYVAASRNPVMYLFDPTTHERAKTVGPFEGLGVRPFSVNKEESLVLVNLVALLGFAVGDVATGKQVHLIKQTTPAERTSQRGAEAPRHGADPVYYTLSHGIAVRPPDSKEVWFIDDLWGYLYVYDIAASPPRHVANVPIFERIDRPFSTTNARWVTFSIDGRYAYPASGLVVDAVARKLLPEKITQSEKMVEVQWRGGTVIAVSGQMGGVYPR